MHLAMGIKLCSEHRTVSNIVSCVRLFDFSGREHQNWFGMDEQLGPVAISIRKDANQYRIIVRTSELLTLRGSVPEEALGIRPQGRLPTRELLELVAPEVQLGCLRLGTAAAEEALARLDEQGLSNRYKVGVLYCRSGQRTEEEMYNNQHAGPAFLEFLDAIGKHRRVLNGTRVREEIEWCNFATGQRIRLRGFEGYKAGLDTRTDSTGTHAVAATHRGAEVTFHVSTMLPFTPNNRQQLLRKRHIGNDIVTIVFQVCRRDTVPETRRFTVLCTIDSFRETTDFAFCLFSKDLFNAMHNRNPARYRSAREGYVRNFNTCSSWSEPLIRVPRILNTAWPCPGARRCRFSDHLFHRVPRSPRERLSPISFWLR